MYTVDLHLKKETVDTAIANLYSSINIARRTKEKLICLIVGYGSTGGTHKIKTAIENELNELKNKNQIKGFINGNELDIFNVKYQNFKYKMLLTEEVKRSKNPGAVYIIL